MSSPDTRRRRRTASRPPALRPAAVSAPRAPTQARMCGDVCPQQPCYVCTHRPGHTDDHAAHGEPYAVLATWPRDEEEL